MEEEIKNDELHVLSEPTVSQYHTWRQMGPQIVCESCESVHGYYIGIKRRMIGVDINGFPIIEKLNF